MAVEAHAIKDRLTRIARAAERGERIVREANGHEIRRTRDQIRAEALADRHRRWRVAQESGSALLWTSPTGRTHLDRPPGRIRGATPVR